MLASRDTSSSSSETQNGHITIAQTIGGAVSGPTINASYDRNQTKDKTTTYNNATLTATDINIITAGDTRIEGANLSADNRLNLDVGGDLLLESKQNRASGSNKGFGISGGFSFNAGNEAPDSVSSAVGGALSSLAGKTVATTNIGDTSGGVGSVNGGLNASAGRYQNKETVLSSITGNEVNVNVAGNTNIVGALLASLNSEGQDNGKLSLATGSLSFTDLTNTRFNSQVSGGISANIGITTQTTQANDANAKTNTLPETKVTGDGETSSNSLDVNSSQYSYSNESSYDKSKTLATLGQGTVLVGGVSIDGINISGANVDAINPAQGTASNVLAGLNRDTDNIDKTFYSVDRQQGNIDITVDHEQVAVAAEAVANAVDQVASVLVTEVAQFMYDIDNPNITALLQGKEEQTLDALIKKGVDPSVAKDLLTNPEFYNIIADMLVNGDLIGTLSESVPQVDVETIEPASSALNGGPLDITLTQGRVITPAQEVIIGLDNVKAFAATLPAEQVEAAMLAVGILTGGAIRTAFEVGKGLAVETAFGDVIKNAKETTAKYIASGVQGVDVETHERFMDMEGQFGKGLSLSLQGGTEFGLEVIAFGSAGLGVLKRGNGDSPVQELDVDSFQSLKKREVVGDELEHDHIPSAASIIKAEETRLRRDLTPEEKRFIYNNATAVERTKESHKSSPTHSGKNTAVQIENDSINLLEAACRDCDSLRVREIGSGKPVIVIDEVIKKIHDRNVDVLNLYKKVDLEELIKRKKNETP